MFSLCTLPASVKWSNKGPFVNLWASKLRKEREHQTTAPASLFRSSVKLCSSKAVTKRSSSPRFSAFSSLSHCSKLLLLSSVSSFSFCHLNYSKFLSSISFYSLEAQVMSCSPFQYSVLNGCI